MTTTPLLATQPYFRLLDKLKVIFSQLEQFRVQTHLHLVEQHLRSKSINHLPVELQQARLKNLDHLHTYWQTGVFPHNRDFWYRRMPYFKDAVGTPCAMAYLIEQSGAQTLVDTVAATNNHVYINDLTSGPVVDWIARSGLTQDEAARIQPSYGGECYLDGTCSIAHPNPWLALVITITWITVSVSFILLEVMSYKVAAWLTHHEPMRRLVAWGYFSVVNIVLLLLAYPAIKEIVRDIVR